MKNSLRITILLFLTAVILGSMGCTKRDPSFLNGKVAEMIDCDVVHDEEHAYALLYPGVTDHDTFASTAESIYEYFPVTADYELTLTAWDFRTGIGNGNEVLKGQYRVEFDGKAFIVTATWLSDEGGSGFTEFRVASEEDLNSAQGT